MRSYRLILVVPMCLFILSGCIEDQGARSDLLVVSGRVDTIEGILSGRALRIDSDPQLEFTIKDLVDTGAGYGRSIHFSYVVKQASKEDLGAFNAEVFFELVGVGGDVVREFSEIVSVGADGLGAGVITPYIPKGLDGKVLSVRAVKYNWWFDNTVTVKSSVME